MRIVTGLVQFRHYDSPLINKEIGITADKKQNTFFIVIDDIVVRLDFNDVENELSDELFRYFKEIDDEKID